MVIQDSNSFSCTRPFPAQPRYNQLDDYRLPAASINGRSRIRGSKESQSPRCQKKGDYSLCDGLVFKRVPEILNVYTHRCSSKSFRARSRKAALRRPSQMLLLRKDRRRTNVKLQWSTKKFSHGYTGLCKIQV